MAGFLTHEKKIEPDDVFPLCFHKSKGAVVATIALLRAGGACVHVRFSHPVSRLRTIIRETQAFFALTDGNVNDLFKQLPAPAISITEGFMSGLCKPLCLAPLVGSENLAFLVYASGSTGVPKGILYEHAGLCNNIRAHSNAFSITSNTRALQFAAYIFDVSIEDTFATLAQGGCVCVPSE